MRDFLLLFSAICCLFYVVGCNFNSGTPLPVIDPFPDDSVDYAIPAFQFVDQDSNVVTESLVKNKIYVADFFFTSCPDICPRMSKEMLRLHDEFLDEPDVLLISHTLDPEHDSVGRLKNYAIGLGVETSKWRMLTTPDEDYVYEVCKTYLLSANPDESLLGGIFHSGKFVLIDRKGRIRGFYEGTSESEVDVLIKDIGRLLDGET